MSGAMRHGARGRTAVVLFGAKAWTVDDPRIEPCPTTGCWLWALGVDRGGYGFTRDNGRTAKAHRAFWMRLRGGIPHGMFLDHACRNRACVNPDHLRIATPRQNALYNSDSVAVAYRARTHCGKGHALARDNVIVQPSRPRSRVCRQCMREKAIIRNRKVRARPALLAAMEGK